MPFETIQSDIKYRGRAFNVRCDQVRLPTGQVSHLDIVDHVGAVTLIPMDDDGNILFVRQYRHAAGIELLEMPAGTLELGELPEQCAQREIREETGMAARELIKIGEFFLAPGYSTEYMSVYLATHLYSAPLQRDADEFLSLQKIAIEQAYQMASSGEIRDAKSLVALFLLKNHLENQKP